MHERSRFQPDTEIEYGAKAPQEGSTALWVLVAQDKHTDIGAFDVCSCVLGGFEGGTGVEALQSRDGLGRDARQTLVSQRPIHLDTRGTGALLLCCPTVRRWAWQ
jgi:hypothetical protein